jgi:hypothetical protein
MQCVAQVGQQPADHRHAAAGLAEAAFDEVGVPNAVPFGAMRARNRRQTVSKSRSSTRQGTAAG